MKTKQYKYLDKQKIIDRGIDLLYKGLGPVDTRRFLTFAHTPQREDSVTRHRKLQENLNREEFLAEIRRIYGLPGK